jgi:FixJ family two-component response regulator
MRNRPNVWIIDDEITVLRVTEALLASLNEFELRSFQSAAALLSAIEPNVVDCVVSDIAMPEIDGSELQRELLKIDRSLSMVFLSGRADIPTTVELMQRGAVTLLEKPFQASDLTDAVRKAIRQTNTKREHLAEINEIINKIRTLDVDEIDVLFCIIAGLSNKTAAYQLSLSARTFDRRRQRVFQVMRVDSPAELATKIERCRPHFPADLEAASQRHLDKT